MSLIDLLTDSSRFPLLYIGVSADSKSGRLLSAQENVGERG